ncbi:MAG TPA: hypothetical protein VGD98_09675 [Ktedonobacteraceae bacterium]
MKNAELERVSILLEQASSPEEVFGQLPGTSTEKLAAARKVFLRIAKIVHPDTNEGTDDSQKAEKAFKQLALHWEIAQKKISTGTYGKVETAGTFIPFTIQTPDCTYALESLLSRGDLCNLYVGSATSAKDKKRVLLKVAIRPRDNDLVANEGRILRHLSAADNYEDARHFASQLVAAFVYEERATGIVRQITVLKYVGGLFSLKEVKETYPQGIDSRDMAWIWRRLLVALDFAHSNKVMHGAVLPTHVLLHPQRHGVVLIDWSYAVLNPAVTHAWISALNAGYRAWYPAEVFAREEPRPGLDIYMASKCMIELLGGDPQQQTMPDSIPWQLQNHLKGCLLPLPHQRLQDASVLLQEFDELLERLWGPRKFHPFSMPQR